MTDETEAAPEEFGVDPSLPRRSGFVALIGAPNAGKSTLINQLVGTKVSIVTHKVQTTRTQIRGIVMAGGAQIVFIDTPGIFEPKRRLDRAMVTSAWAGAGDADVVAFLIDAERGIKGDAIEILQKLQNTHYKKILILNKIDRVPNEKLLALAASATDITNFDKVFMISALKGFGCADIIKYLSENLAEGPWYYPEDQLSDIPMRMTAAEVTREKLMLRLHQELPYASHVETEQWVETNKDVRVEQVIYVERDAHKKIVIGAKGQTLRSIGEASRKELTEMMGKPVHVFLFVKVRENWVNDPERYREMGLEFTP
jgi:GTPase